MRWLLDACGRRGIRLAASGGEYLLDRIGPDLQELSRELEKLALAVPPGEPVGADVLSEMVRQGELGSGWELVESVLAGHPSEALRQWTAVSAEEPVLRLQWLLQKQARDRLARGGRGSTADLRRTLLHAYDLERGIKTGRIPSGRDGIAFECLMVSAGGGPTRPQKRS